MFTAYDVPARSCRAGCHWCCYEPVEAFPAEIKLASWGIVHARRDQQVEIFSRLGAWTEAYRAAELHLRPLDFDAYRHAQLLCPFCLDGLCAIYEVRPLNCRLFASCSDPETCRPTRTVHEDIPKAIEVCAAAILALSKIGAPRVYRFQHAVEAIAHYSKIAPHEPEHIWDVEKNGLAEGFLGGSPRMAGVQRAYRMLTEQ
jgi:Fe-S-cluster containining protein